LLASVGRGYNVALMLQGCETEAPRFVPQLLRMLFEEALPFCCSDHVFSTLSLVQISPSGQTQDLLSPGWEELPVLDVAPVGLVVENASEIEVSDSQAASELYLQAAGSEGRNCPLLQVLAGEAAGQEEEGSLAWIISWLLEGNNYTSLLLRLNPQGCSLSLLQAALLGASGRRMQVKQVRPTLWDATEETRARQANLKTLRLDLLGDTLTDGGLNRLGRALWELQVIKARSLRSQTPKRARNGAMRLPEPQVKGKLLKSCEQRRHFSHLSESGIGLLGPRLHQKHPFRDSEEQFHQTPDVALQFFLAQARRQKLREQHQIWIQEELKHLQQQEDVAGEQIKSLVTEEVCEQRQRQCKEKTVLRLQVEVLQAERDTAEQDLVALYDLYVQATQARTCHLLQVFQAWQELWEEKALATEHHNRSLLARILQDTIDLALKNQELQAQNQQLEQTAGRGSQTGFLTGEERDQECSGANFLPHS
uniref:Riken cDNA E230025N22 gene n=1 Tax=Nannospalax galili TaxID=1026970 RepID=A0A8C6RT09_NANGA